MTPGPSAAYTFASQAACSTACVVYVIVLIAYNMVMPTLGNGWLVAVVRVPFNMMWLLSIWSFGRAWASDPGALPPRWQSFVTTCGAAMPIAPARKEWQPRKATMCSKCRFPRPERAHHCAVCNQCVLRYDHHCPWINNCVGFRNHKFFLQLSVYTWILGFLMIVSIAPQLPLCFRDMGSKTDPYGLRSSVIITLLLLGFVVCLFLSVILRYHIPLAMRNLTSVEDFYENMPNPFDQGNILGNLAQIFGEFGPDWLLPIRPCRPVSDGVTFPGGPNEPPLMMPVGSTPLPSDRTDQGLLLEKTFEGDIMEDALTLLPCSCGCAGDGDGDGLMLDHDLKCDSMQVEELWRTRFKVRSLRERVDHHFEDDLASTEGSPRAPTLLKDLWSSFWWGRKQPRSSVWL